jgi:sporulation protein YlmC with PRC-barrel domain
MKFSELKGRAVVDVQSAHKIGEVEDLSIEPGSHKIASVKVKTGLFSPSQVVQIGDVKSIGQDAVTVSGVPTKQDQAAATATTAPGTEQTGAPVMPAHVELSDLLDTKVVTDTGTLVGEVHDVMVDPEAMQVTGYEVKPGGLFARAHEISATPDVRYGKKLITVPAGLVNPTGGGSGQ